MRRGAGAGRHRLRDATLILLAYRHGLRVSELVALRWDPVDLTQGLMHISRRKNGVPSAFPGGIAGRFWTSWPHRHPRYAWYVDCDAGQTGYLSKDARLQVRLVRGRGA